MSTEPFLGVGSTIGPYRLDALLGRGGMGVVYRAEDVRLGRKVALKLLRASLADEGTYRERFLRESRLAASIEHAAIVPIYDAGETDGLLYIAMRFVDGVDLAELLHREEPLAPERAVALVGQLASALDAAHARGLIHRDVKPSNALIGTDGDGEHAYLVDFGITQDTASHERLTGTDQLVGTLNYLAPERIRGEPVDGRADIYALGCVLFECLTGQVPFSRASEAAAIYAHLEEQPPRASDLRPGLPKALDAVVARALAKDRADRWQTGAELRAAAQRAVLPGAPARAGLPLRIRAAAAAALAALATVAGAALLFGGDDRLAGIDANWVGVIDADSGRITTQYSVGRDPGAIAAGAGSVWVANRVDGTVSRITGDRREVVPIPVEGEPTGLAYGAGSLWVADGQGRTVSQVDSQLNRVVKPYDVGNAAHAVAVGSGAVWAASAVDATVARIDLTSGRVSKRIEVGGRPSALAAGAGAIWVASEDTATVIRLDPRSGTPVASIPVGNGPSGIAVGAGAVWVANRRDGTVSRIDPETDKATDLVPVGREPRAVAADEDGVWVANAGDGTVMRIDPSSGQVTRTIDVQNRPSALAVVDGGVWAAALAATSTHRGGTLRVTVFDDGGRLVTDPASLGAFSPPTSLVYDGLVAYRRAGGSAGTALVADLASDLPVPSSDGRTYRLRLRPDLRFSNGAPVTPEDVRASLARMLALGDPGYYDELDAIPGAARCADRRLRARARFQHCDLSDGVETDAAARTITFRLTRPDTDFLHKLHSMFVVPAGSPGRLVNTPALPGTGPYTIKRWDPRRGGLLVRNPHFRAWSPDRPDGFPDQISIRFQKAPAQIAAVEDGAADIAVFNGSTRYAARLRARHGARLHADPAPGTAYAFLNVRAPPFDDVRVRRALNFAVDRGRLAELIGSETHTPTCQMLPPGMQGYTPSCPFTVNPNPAGTWTGPDLARARRLVAASGTRGMKVEFWGAREGDEAFGRYFRTVLTAIGYRASVREFAHLGLIGENAADERPPHPQLGLWFWYANSLAPLTFLQPSVSCSNAVNFSRFCSSRNDARMEQAARARGPEAIRQWRRVETELAAQAPTVPFLNWSNTSLTAERVGNYQAHPLRGPLLEQLWVR